MTLCLKRVFIAPNAGAFSRYWVGFPSPSRRLPGFLSGNIGGACMPSVLVNRSEVQGGTRSFRSHVGSMLFGGLNMKEPCAEQGPRQRRRSKRVVVPSAPRGEHTVMQAATCSGDTAS